MTASRAHNQLDPAALRRLGVKLNPPSTAASEMAAFEGLPHEVQRALDEATVKWESSTVVHALAVAAESSRTSTADVVAWIRAQDQTLLTARTRDSTAAWAARRRTLDKPEPSE